MIRYREAEEVGAEIARLRALAGLEQRQLADQIGLDPSALSRIEKGKRGLGADELFRLAGALGVEADRIMVADDAPVGVLLRTGGADDAGVREGLRVLEEAIADFFSARALARLM
jgi:transcriptional regulator with XRE-family HTH domain